MKNQYFGDVNDYLKYGLLRCFAEAGLRVGVCWMLTPDDSMSDGRKTGYLTRPLDWRGHDPALFDALQKAVLQDGCRHVSVCEELGVIPNAVYFRDLVPDIERDRRTWFLQAKDRLAGCDLVFFDPDNGLEVRSKPRGRKGSSKYLFWDEAETIWEGGGSLLLFQHFARERRSDHSARLVSELENHLTGPAAVTALSSANVLFLLAAQSVHLALVEEGLALVQPRWSSRINVVSRVSEAPHQDPNKRSREVSAFRRLGEILWEIAQAASRPKDRTS